MENTIETQEITKSTKQAKQKKEQVTVTDETLAAVAAQLGLASVAALKQAAQLGKTIHQARCEIGTIRAKLPEVGEATYSVRNKRTEMLEGKHYDLSAMPDKEIARLAKLTGITKAAERIAKGL